MENWKFLDYNFSYLGPLFSKDKPNERIDKNDALHTIAIHTNGGTLGYYEPICKVDVYPNGGHSQPGCGIGKKF